MYTVGIRMKRVHNIKRQTLVHTQYYNEFKDLSRDYYLSSVPLGLERFPSEPSYKIERHSKMN